MVMTGALPSFWADTIEARDASETWPAGFRPEGLQSDEKSPLGERSLELLH